MLSAAAARISPRTWIIMAALALTEQIAWAVENSWFNAFVSDTITPDPRPVAWMVAASAITATLTTLLIGSALVAIPFGIPTTLNGEAGYIPTPIIFQVGSLIALLGLITLSLLRTEKQDDPRHHPA